MVIRDMPKNQALFEELQTENRRLHNFLNAMLQTIKQLFRKLLHIGSEKR